MSEYMEWVRVWFGKQWFVLPGFSGALLILSFHPFNLWPLVFVALAPLLYFVAAYQHSTARVFWGGFLAGAMFALSLSYFTVVHFNWLPETYLFNALVRALFVPVMLLGGMLCGGAMVLYRALRLRGAVFQNTLISAAAYTGSEVILYTAAGGYYFAMLSYAAVDVPGFLALAPFGGAFLGSFAVALVNGLVAEALAARLCDVRLLRRIGTLLLLVAAVVAALAMARHAAPPARDVSVAVIQASSRAAIEFGAEQDGAFSLASLEPVFKDAASRRPDLLIYPFSLVEGAVYAGEKEAFTSNILKSNVNVLGEWLRQQVSAETTVMFWTTLRENGAFYNTFLFYKDGAIIADYRKRALFPFMDYTPQWAQRIGFYSTPMDTTAGQRATVPLFGMDVGALLCSEIHVQNLARAYSGAVPLVVSAGSEAMFADAVASEFSLKAARFRAAEAGVPLVRANILGPSALINADGSLAAYSEREEGGVLYGQLTLGDKPQTFFSRFGNVPIVLLVVGVLLFAAIRRYYA